MKILAIRGCNLASLAGEFEIDLAHGPIASAGVFAIVGPTGAGKSTLLDAMCVALFDRTPRLANRSTVVVGRGDDDPGALGSQDVRGLLRRGASAGYAEVDFESGDLRRYRARWSVRRARGASDGNMQDAHVTLTTIDGVDGEPKRFGGTKTETLKAIHQRLGLTFDQFRRSALLAQGEFAAFLRADGKDRSELLERMTGTEIYSRLSIAAHQRATAADQQLREGRHAALAIAVLPDEARAASEADLAGARGAVVAARIRLASADAAAKWLAEAALRQAALRDAELARVAAEQAVTAAAPERAELALRRRAEKLRPVWDEAARLDRQLAIVRAEVNAAADAVARAALAHETIVVRRARIVELHAPVREGRIAAGVVERNRAEREEHLEVHAAAAATDAAWLVARRGLAIEIAGWRDLDAKFAHHAGLTAEIAAAERGLADHGKRRVGLDKQRALAVAEHQAGNGRLEEAKREVSGFQQRRGLTLDAARREEDAARLRCNEVERLAAISAEARAAATAQTELDRQLADLVTVTANDGKLHEVAKRARDTAATLRTERANVVAELRRAAGYEHARAELVHGEPCPLCGAAEHPWRDHGAFDTLIGEADVRLAEAVRDHDAAVATLAKIAAREDQRGVERGRLTACRATAETTAAGAILKWRHQLAALGELGLVSEPATAAAQQLAEERTETARGKLEAARVARSQAEAVAKASQEAQARVQARQTELELHVVKLKQLDTSLAQLDALVERLRGEQIGKIARHDELAAELASAISRWTQALPSSAPPHSASSVSSASPELTRHAMSELVAAWHVRVQVISELDAGLTAALAEIDQASREIERAVTEHLARRADTERRHSELVGEHAAAVTRLDAARKTVQLAPVELPGANHATSVTGFSARQTAGFEVDELGRLLEGDPGRIQHLIDQLAAIDLAAERTCTLVIERRRRVDDHALARPAALDDATIVEQLAAAVATSEQHAATLAAMLATDLEARARRAAALASLQAAEQAAEIDRVLGQVIGSHDGKLFRSFAQSLTLDGLLEVANSHLEELAPRYQLERVPKHDLELQVIDRDLGGEVRSVQSLSGGESFLVSLALALGLSSMSAHDVRVRTLLIDEGFGTLDPATLDSALAVLDALQATGRQVGVISHVPALVERVGAHVRVAPRGGGRSEVIVHEA